MDMEWFKKIIEIDKNASVFREWCVYYIEENSWPKLLSNMAKVMSIFKNYIIIFLNGWQDIPMYPKEAAAFPEKNVLR